MIASDGRTVTQIAYQAELDAACGVWLRQERLALDTEFVRTNTFYPRAGLLQLADSEGVYLVDPLLVDSWDQFLDVLQCDKIEFVLHSASEDLALLLALFGTLPARIFDTQLAAAYAGYGFSLSYQALVERMIAVTVPKEETRSDWLKRPLSNKQMVYAANDVCYLLDIHEQLKNSLIEKEALEWFAEDSQELIRAAHEQEDPESWKEFYADVSNAWRLSDSALQTLQALCYWRETEARRRDKPRNWIAKDNELLAIAADSRFEVEPTLQNLAAIAELSKGLRQRYGNNIVELLIERPEYTAINRDLLSPPLPPRFRSVLKSWRLIIEARAEHLAIAPELLARKKWMHELLKRFQDSGQLNWQPPMAGWRREELEQAFLQVLE